MENIVNVEGTELGIREYNGQRVVTFRDIDEVHHRPHGTAYRNFRANKRFFNEGRDYITVHKKNQNDEIRLLGIAVPQRGITIITERGYLKVIKSFNDELSWKVQDALVDAYFEVKGKEQNDIPPELRIPLQMDWAKRQKYKINVICENFDCTYAKYISRIIGLIGETYDFDFAMKKYEELTGKKPKYAMDAIGYFPELQKMATDIIMFDYQDMLKRSGLNP